MTFTSSSSSSLTKSLSSQDSNTPSIFELIAQQKLDSLLSPAFHYILTQFALRYPRRLFKLLTYSDEIFASIVLMIQSYYLKKYQSTFSEHFYGLQRLPSKLRYRSKSWTSKDTLKSLLCVVLVPYLKIKLDLVYQSLKENQVDEQEIDDLFDSTSPVSSTTISNVSLSTASNTPTIPIFAKLLSLYSMVTKWFIKCYPYFHFIYEGNQFLFFILYAIKKTSFFNLSLYLSGLKLKWATELKPTSSNPSHTSFSWFMSLPSYFMEFLQTALPSFIFCYKLWTWFIQTHPSFTTNSNTTPTSNPNVDSSSISSLTHFLSSLNHQSHPIPPPPPFLSPHPTKRLNLAPKGSCTLCQAKITNPACLTTGYVFCYPCIHSWIQSHQSCPITLKSMSIQDIHKIYTH